MRLCLFVFLSADSPCRGRSIYAELRVPKPQHEPRKNLVKLPRQWQRKFKCPFGETRTLPLLRVCFFPAVVPPSGSSSSGWFGLLLLFMEIVITIWRNQVRLRVCLFLFAPAAVDVAGDVSGSGLDRRWRWRKPSVSTENNKFELFLFVSCLCGFGARALFNSGRGRRSRDYDKTALDQLVLS